MVAFFRDLLRDFRRNPNPYLFISPFFILFLFFGLVPIFYSFYMSFFEFVTFTEMEFVGLSNYARVFRDGDFRLSVWNTIVIMLVHVPTKVFFALVLAVVLNSKLIKFANFFRLSVFLPVVTAPVVVALVFAILLDTNYGIVNYVLGWFGVTPVRWLTDPFWAKPAVIIAQTWRWLGHDMVIMLAGLQAISKDYYEASSIDGANALQAFWKITVPLMWPVTLFCIVLSTINGLQMFDTVYVLTGGGPAKASLVIGVLLYNNAFQYFRFGYASAMAYVLGAMIFVLSLVQMKFASRRAAS